MDAIEIYAIKINFTLFVEEDYLNKEFTIYKPTINSLFILFYSFDFYEVLLKQSYHINKFPVYV